MENLLVFKKKIQQFYAKHSRYIDPATRFLLSLLVFGLISKETGFARTLASPLAVAGMSLVCGLLPVAATAYVAALLLLVHFFVISKAVAAVSFLIFLVFYIFYLKFAPKTSLIILLTVVAFALKIPYVIPIAVGLLGTPVLLVSVFAGILTSEMVDYVKGIAAAGTGEIGFMEEMTVYLQKITGNKEMWIVFGTVFLSALVVYLVRRMMIANAWKIATGCGVVANIVAISAGDMVLDLHISYPELIIGNIVAIVVGIVLEFLFFAIDYSRGESLRFEDEEFYYYVKAVPKYAVSEPEKTMKKINEREPEEKPVEESEKAEDKTICMGEPTKVEDKTICMGEAAKVEDKTIFVGESFKGSVAEKTPQAVKSQVTGNIDRMLLTQSLKKELHIGEDETK